MGHGDESGRRANLLLAEGDGEPALGLRHALEELGFAVHVTASTVEAALAEAEGRRPDVAIVDVELPDGSCGLWAARRLARGMDIPVVVFGGSALEDEALAAGAILFLAKPHRMEEVQDVLCRALAISRIDHRASAPVSLPA
jgi:CheY-like chemotaxis protein